MNALISDIFFFFNLITQRRNSPNLSLCQVAAARDWEKSRNPPKIFSFIISTLSRNLHEIDRTPLEQFTIQSGKEFGFPSNADLTARRKKLRKVFFLLRRTKFLKRHIFRELSRRVEAEKLFSFSTRKMMKSQQSTTEIDLNFRPI
jgi:hypothetical protein